METSRLTVLPVPLRLSPREYLCSETSASMVLEYYGKRVEPEELERGGCHSLEVMAPCLEKYGLTCRVVEKPDFASVAGELERGHPVQLRLRERELHTVVAFGRMDDFLLVNDPSLGRRIITAREFGERVERALFCRLKG